MKWNLWNNVKQFFQVTFIKLIIDFRIAFLNIWQNWYINNGHVQATYSNYMMKLKYLTKIGHNTVKNVCMHKHFFGLLSNTRQLDPGPVYLSHGTLAEIRMSKKKMCVGGQGNLQFSLHFTHRLQIAFFQPNGRRKK